MEIKLKSFKFIAVIFILAIVAAAWIIVVRLEGVKPVLQIKGLASSIRNGQMLNVSVSDKKSGIRQLRVVLRKGNEDHILYDKKLPGINFFMGGSVHDYAFDLKIELKKLGITDGQALITIDAQDYSWRRWWHGNRAVIEQQVLIDTRRPRIEVLSHQHNITQGGAGLVIYKLSETCPVHGVYVGNNFFPGYSAQNINGLENSDIFMSFIALDYKHGQGTQIFIQADDPAGNSSRAGFNNYIKKRVFKKDIIKISDNFLNQKLPEFNGDMPENTPLIKQFLIINSKLRLANTEQFKKLGENTENNIYWKGAFLRLPKSARRANFADHREYIYNNEAVDHQVHMGIDLASTARSPVPAANSGRVIFTGDIGIYGRTIMIDHGFGLFSTYSHLSHINVEEGQMVSKGHIIGKTGLTGMAGGDHLHFGMMIHKTFVNPVEWWDDSWIKNNITNKIKEIKSEG